MYLILCLGENERVQAGGRVLIDESRAALAASTASCRIQVTQKHLANSSSVGRNEVLFGAELYCAPVCSEICLYGNIVSQGKKRAEFPVRIGGWMGRQWPTKQTLKVTLSLISIRKASHPNVLNPRPYPRVFDSISFPPSLSIPPRSSSHSWLLYYYGKDRSRWS